MNHHVLFILARAAINTSVPLVLDLPYLLLFNRIKCEEKYQIR